jgi:HK97 family phage prohead protease
MREREFASFPLELAQMSTTGNTMKGYASVFNFPIESGRDQKTFVKPGAFTKTLKENRPQIQVLVNHGMDPRFGLLPIGVPTVLQEDKKGLWAEVELHGGPDNDNIKAALASGSLRAQSIQFEVMQESFNDDRTERNIEQVRLYEFGPVTFPANEAATASLHSMAAMATLLRDVTEEADSQGHQAEASSAGDRATEEAGTSPADDRPTVDVERIRYFRLLDKEDEERLARIKKMA